jgi:hypothetical protein
MNSGQRRRLEEDWMLALPRVIGIYEGTTPFPVCDLGAVMTRPLAHGPTSARPTADGECDCSRDLVVRGVATIRRSN